MLKKYTTQIDNLVHSLKKSSIPCQLIQVKGRIYIILGSRYPEELGAEVSEILRTHSIDGDIVGSVYFGNKYKKELDIEINGGPQDYDTPLTDEDPYMMNEDLKKLIREEILQELLVAPRDHQTYRKNEWNLDLILKLYEEYYGLDIKEEGFAHKNDIDRLLDHYGATHHQGKDVLKNMVNILTKGGYEVI